MEAGVVMPYYGKRYIIPNWYKGSHQMYYKQSDGTWVDTFNECERSQAWIDEHVAKYIQPAPDDISLTDFLKSLNDLSTRTTGFRTEDEMSNVGFGVMLGMLFGNEETVNTIKASLGKTISNVALIDDKLKFVFTDSTKIVLYDAGQSCCENRYMTTDDDLSYFKDCTFDSVELRDAPNIPDSEEHEVQFLLVTTSKGVFTMETHNEHNGYYGGFLVVARPAN